MNELGGFLIDATRRRLTGFAAQVRTCLEALSDSELWDRAHEKGNSVGNLVLHLCGSTRHFLGRGVGGSGYKRDRTAEFTERGPVPRGDLLRLLEETLQEAERVLGDLDPGRLMETTDRVSEPRALADHVLRVSHHWATHTGQIVFHVKSIKPGAFEELWMKTMENR